MFLLKTRWCFSAVKGIVPENNTIVGEFLHNQYKVPYENIGVITGPCHMKKLVLERLSYLTVACSDLEKAKLFANSIEGGTLKQLYLMIYMVQNTRLYLKM